ncbi:ArdC-like ssDNA-binding domain-containing protein [Paenibacillus larvae]|uniref:ArdC-like ssDNA-binding domain-containing protein n=2 Tax=Paenibacillus larvae TaxID=1464 RepID=UPI00228265FE|nr:ArdC-like ssDNA-binding domain-containing protein [Paenibacillus larvae]MCY9747641.1 ArdC-like ssDNA-binding domain-containing protein [Paenibacillus larvae]
MVTTKANHKYKMATVKKELEKTLERIFQDGEFQRYLAIASRFPKYSINNILMIYQQNPEATMVRGRSAWKEIGRYIKPGEFPIKIFAPQIIKREETKIDPKTGKPVLNEKGEEVKIKKEALRGFRLVDVYDVSQTTGKELVDVRQFIRADLKESNRTQALYEKFKDHLSKKMDVKEEILDDPEVRGYYNNKGHSIRINASTVNTTMKFRTLIHEYAHSQLHHKDKFLDYQKNRGYYEAQAETTAYMVSKYFGIDTEAYSVGYVSTWAKDLGLAKKALTEIQKVANHIIREVDEVNKELALEMEKSVQQDTVSEKDEVMESKKFPQFIKDFFKEPSGKNKKQNKDSIWDLDR